MPASCKQKGSVLMQHLPGITPWCIFRRGKVTKQGLKVRHKVPYSVFFPFLVGCHTGASVTFSFTHFKLNQTLKLWMFDHKTPHHQLDLDQTHIMFSQVLVITGQNSDQNNSYCEASKLHFPPESVLFSRLKQWIRVGVINFDRICYL